MLIVQYMGYQSITIREIPKYRSLYHLNKTDIDSQLVSQKEFSNSKQILMWLRENIEDYKKQEELLIYDDIKIQDILYLTEMKYPGVFAILGDGNKIIPSRRIPIYKKMRYISPDEEYKIEKLVFEDGMDVNLENLVNTFRHNLSKFNNLEIIPEKPKIYSKLLEIKKFDEDYVVLEKLGKLGLDNVAKNLSSIPPSYQSLELMRINTSLSSFDDIEEENNLIEQIIVEINFNKFKLTSKIKKYEKTAEEIEKNEISKQKYGKIFADLTKEERENVVLHFKIQEKNYNDEVNNKCPHLRVEDTKLQKFKGKIFDGWYHCNLCKKKLICSHKTEVPSITSPDFRDKLFKFTIDAESLNCKYCGEEIVSPDLIFMEEIDTKLFDPEIKSLIWSESLFLHKFIKSEIDVITFSSLIQKIIPSMIYEDQTEERALIYIYALSTLLDKNIDKHAKMLKFRYAKLFPILVQKLNSILLIASEEIMTRYKNIITPTKKDNIADIIKFIICHPIFILAKNNAIDNKIIDLKDNIFSQKTFNKLIKLQKNGVTNVEIAVDLKISTKEKVPLFTKINTISPIGTINYTSLRTSDGVSLAALYDINGKELEWKVNVYENQFDHKIIKTEKKEIPGEFYIYIDKETKDGTSYNSEFDNFEKGEKISKILNKFKKINLFGTFYETRCPIGGIHDFNENKCMKCKISVNSLKQKNNTEFLKYFDKFLNTFEMALMQQRESYTTDYIPPIEPEKYIKLGDSKIRKSITEFAHNFEVPIKFIENLGNFAGNKFTDLLSGTVNIIFNNLTTQNMYSVYIKLMRIISTLRNLPQHLITTSQEYIENVQKYGIEKALILKLNEIIPAINFKNIDILSTNHEDIYFQIIGYFCESLDQIFNNGVNGIIIAKAIFKMISDEIKALSIPQVEEVTTLSGIDRDDFNEFHEICEDEKVHGDDYFGEVDYDLSNEGDSLWD